MANAARTAVATAVSWVAKMSDMGEGYGGRGPPARDSGSPSSSAGGRAGRQVSPATLSGDGWGVRVRRGGHDGWGLRGAGGRRQGGHDGMGTARARRGYPTKISPGL